MRHEPVLLQEVLNSLALVPGMNVVDGTLGDAGHAERILEITGRDGRRVCLVWSSMRNLVTGQGNQT